MAITVLPLDASSGAPAYTAQQTRTAFSAFLGTAPTGRPLGAISGVRPGTPSTTASLSGAGSTTWNVAAHSGVIDAETAAAGPYLYATDGTDTGTITAANATNPRIDILYVQVNDNVMDGSGLESGVVGYLAGTAAATPSPPAAPARSMVLANITVPKSGSGAPTISWVASTYGQAPRCQVVQTATQSIPNSGTGAAINFTSATVNNGGMWVSGSSLTIVTPGTYEVTAGASFASNATGYRYISVLVNGTGVITAVSPAVSGGTTTPQIPTYELPSLAAGTVITLQAFQNSGAPLSTFVTSGNAVWLRLKWISS